MDFQQHTSQLSGPQGGAIARTHEAHFFAYLKPAEVNIAIKMVKTGAGSLNIQNTIRRMTWERPAITVPLKTESEYLFIHISLAPYNI